MTAPITYARTFRADSRPELESAIAEQMRRWGYRVEREEEAMCSVGALSNAVGRTAGSVSRALRRASCPTFSAIWGAGAIRRRILKIRPTPELIEYLQSNRP